MRLFAAERRRIIIRRYLPAFLPLLIIFVLLFDWIRPFKVTNTFYLKIEKGDTLDDVLADLYGGGIFPGRLSFKLYYKIFPGKINAGDYYLKGNVSIIRLASLFAKGHEKGIRVTLPEGISFKEIASRLYDSGVIASPDAFAGLYEDAGLLRELKVGSANFEGYCYPDTYYFSSSADPREIFRDLCGELRFRIKESGLEERIAASEMTLNEILTLASIIEGEAKTDEERPLIAQVFIKRLKIEQPLESCATIQYALGEHREKLSFRDLEIESPYNTYKNYGLPPTPINSPGIESIKAVLNPSDTDFLYFVSKKDGTHHFSVTYPEHLAAKRKYLK